MRFSPKAELLSAAEIEQVVRAAVSVGFRKFRLTGGEPTIRSDLVEIIERVASVPGVGELAMTTNALLLAKLAKPLKQAGLSRVNVHLDSLNPATVERLMRWGTFEQMWAGIMAAEAEGLTPIKLNAVVTAGFNETDVVDLARLTLERDWHVRFIELMPLGGGECASISIKRYVSNIETRRRIEAELGPMSRGGVAQSVRRVGQLSAARRQGNCGLHQSGQRALLRDLQSDASDGGRQVPSVPAQRRRDGRAQSTALAARQAPRLAKSWSAP